MLKTYNVITRNITLVVGAESVEDAVRKSSRNAGRDRNVFVRESGVVKGYEFMVKIVSLSVKQTGVLIQFSSSAETVMNYAEHKTVGNPFEELPYYEHMGSQDLLLGLVKEPSGISGRFLRAKGITVAKIFTAMSQLDMEESSYSAQFLLNNFLGLIFKFGVYIDTRVLFFVAILSNSNAEKIIKFLGYNFEEFISEYISYLNQNHCGISRYFLRNQLNFSINETADCFDGMDIYKKINNQFDETEMTALQDHLKTCNGLCLRTASFVQSSLEKVVSESFGKKPELLW